MTAAAAAVPVCSARSFGIRNRKGRITVVIVADFVSERASFSLEEKMIERTSRVDGWRPSACLGTGGAGGWKRGRNHNTKKVANHLKWHTRVGSRETAPVGLGQTELSWVSQSNKGINEESQGEQSGRD